MKVSYWILEIQTDSLTFNFSKWLFGSTIEWSGLANFPFLQVNCKLWFVIVKKWWPTPSEDSFTLSIICTFYSKNVILQNLHEFTTCQLSLAECDEQRWSKTFLFSLKIIRRRAWIVFRTRVPSCTRLKRPLAKQGTSKEKGSSTTQGMAVF